MRRVYKYPFDVTGHIEIVAPEGMIPLRVLIQHGSPCLWALVDPSKPPRTHHFRLAGTGHDIEEENLRFVDTFLMSGGALVWHVFYVGVG